MTSNKGYAFGGVICMKEKNLAIELWRFILAIYIVVYHYLRHNWSINIGGYIAVEFFFIYKWIPPLYACGEPWNRL